MKQLGVVLDLANARVEFKQLSATVPLRDTKTGLCGFDINFEKRYECPDEQLHGPECEVVLHPWESNGEQEIMKVIQEMMLSSSWSGCCLSGVDIATERSMTAEGPATPHGPSE